MSTQPSHPFVGMHNVCQRKLGRKHARHAKHFIRISQKLLVENNKNRDRGGRMWLEKEYYTVQLSKSINQSMLGLRPAEPADKTKLV